ncbi:MAG: hypothetical protein O8C64_04880 [Candidatus Methanoperedens sp.]|nr:hypothetical protein [Candidatus Methanoperedens sp.]
MNAGMRSLREQALQGTTALLAGLGIGLLLKQLASLVLPESFISDAVIYALIIASVFLVYRYVIGSQQKSEPYFTLALSIIIGIAAAFLAQADYPVLEGDSGDYIMYVFILIALGALIGAPRIRSMAILALAGFTGGTIGTLVYLQGVDFVYFIKEPKREFINYLINNFGMGVGMGSFVTSVIILSLAAFVTLMFTLGVGIAGSSISIAMGSGKVAMVKTRSAYFNIIRKLGIGIAVFMLFSYAYVLFTSGGEYAITASGVSIDTDNKTATVYVPVFIDSKGAVLDVYGGSEIFGNATYEIVDTEYGKAMKVTATGNILIFTKHPEGAKRSNREVNRYLKDFGLSMSDFKPLEGDATEILPVKIMPKTGIWVYSDSEIKSLNLMLGRDSGVGISYSMGFPYYERSNNMMVPMSLTRGWQRIELETTIRRYSNFL